MGAPTFNNGKPQAQDPSIPDQMRTLLGNTFGTVGMSLENKKKFKELADANEAARLEQQGFMTGYGGALPDRGVKAANLGNAIEPVDPNSPASLTDSVASPSKKKRFATSPTVFKGASDSASTTRYTILGQ